MINSSNIVEVGISMVLRDNFTQESGKISQAFSNMMSDMRNLLQGFDSSYGNFNQVGQELVSSMYDAYKYAAGVQNEIFLTSKIAGATAVEAKQLLKTAQDINMETPLTGADIASGERFLAMAGKTASEIQDLIKPAAQLATIFGGAVGGKGGYADMMTNMMAMFNLTTKQTPQVANDLYVAVTSANMSMEDLMATIRYAGADMNAAGVGLREVAAAAGALGDVGIQASMAGTSLSNMIRNLQLSLAQQKKLGSSWLTELGLSPEDFYTAEGEFKGLYNAMQQFLEVYRKLSPLSRTQAFYNILGVRGMRAMIPMLEAMDKGNDKMATILTKMQENAGALDNTMKEFLKENQGVIEQFNSAVENWKITFGTVIAPFFKKVLSNVITPVIDKTRTLMQDNEFVGNTVGSIAGAGTIWIATKILTGVLRGIQKLGLYVEYVKSQVGQISAKASATVGNISNLVAICAAGFRTTEAHLITIMRNQGLQLGVLTNILQVQMMKAGLGMGKGGRFFVQNPNQYKQATGKTQKAGTFANQPRVYMFGKGMVDGNVMKRWLSSKAASTAGRGGGAAVGKALIGFLPKLLSWGGKIAGILARGVHWIGWILTAIELFPVLVDIGEKIYNWVTGKKSMEEKAQEDLKRRKEQAEQVWYTAIRQGIIDGMSGSNVRITVNSDSMNWSPGTSVDYTGAALIGQ